MSYDIAHNTNGIIMPSNENVLVKTIWEWCRINNLTYGNQTNTIWGTHNASLKGYKSYPNYGAQQCHYKKIRKNEYQKMLRVGEEWRKQKLTPQTLSKLF